MTVTTKIVAPASGVEISVFPRRFVGVPSTDAFAATLDS
jgi:hypothetical protein